MVFKFLKLAGITFVLALLTSNTLSAQGQDKTKERQPMNVDQMFERMDANKDKKLSLEEVRGPLKNDFSKVDTNADGFISKEELTKAPKPKMNKQKDSRGQFEKMDSNADGKLSKEEVSGPLKTNFSKIDANSDGYISKAEMQNASKSK